MWPRLTQPVASRRFAIALLAFVLIWECTILLLKGSRQPFWYDELMTYHVSGLEPFSRVLEALRDGVDGMPPGYHIIVRLARRFSADSHVSLRLPSVLGYLASLLAAYWFVRKRLPEVAGFAAVLLIVLSPFRWYALEARSYALLVGFLAIAALVWQRIGERRLMTPLLALFLALAASCHHLGVLAISCFAVAEMLCTFLTRRIRWGVWIAFGLATFPFLWNLPNLLRFRDNFGKYFWSRPDWSSTYATYETYLGISSIHLGLLLVVFFGIAISHSLIRRLTRNDEAAEGFRVHEIGLILAFLFFPVLLVVLTKIFQSGYTGRYGWPAILGLVWGFIYVLRPVWTASPAAILLGTLWIGFAFQGVRDIRGLFKPPDTAVLQQRWTGFAELISAYPQIPVVIAKGNEYLPAAMYAPPALRNRLTRVVNADAAARLIGADTADQADSRLARYLPLQITDLASFEAAHKKFVLYSNGYFGWIQQYLLERHYRMTLLSLDDRSFVYLVEGDT